MPTLSVIVPTVGRPSLAVTLASIRARGLLPGDEVLCVGDGPCPQARRIWQRANLPGAYLETARRHRDWGATPRTLGMGAAKGEWLLFMDDDDVYLPGAFLAVRTVGPRRPHLFRSRCEEAGGLLWRQPKVVVGNIGTQMIVVPNDPARMGYWTGRREGDFDFIASTLAHYPEGPVWREEVLSECRNPRGPALARLAQTTRYDPSDRDPHNLCGGLIELAQFTWPLSVVEIGCHRGVSTEVWLWHAESVLAVDPWPDATAQREFLIRCGGFPGLRVHQGYSVDAAQRYPDGHFDLAYIDGDHEYPSVVADIRAWRPKVRRWLAGHDYSPIHTGVRQAVDELLGVPRVFGDTSWLVEV